LIFSEELQELKLPEELSIVGSGPKGVETARHLTGSICGVNQAIELPLYCDYWFISDCSLAGTQWFREACMQRLDLVRIFHQGLSSYTPYTFVPDADCEKTTVLGACLKTFVSLGVQKISLCGFDLEGTENYNGPGIRIAGNLESKAKRCSQLIRKLRKEYGTEFISLTPTTLEI